MAKRYSLTVRGATHLWSFDVLVDPQYVAEWRADGLDLEEVVNVIPAWVVQLGLVRPWCLAQDVFHFRHPWK
jgi:hypothetical protein